MRRFRSKPDSLGGLLLGASLIIVIPVPALPSSSRPGPTSCPAKESLLEVTLNGLELHETALVLRPENGSLWLPETDLRRWRVRLPDHSPLMCQDQAYYRLDEITGSAYRLDEPTQRLFLDLPPTGFLPNRLDRRGLETGVPTSSPLGGFLNYDFFVQSNGDRLQADSLLEFSAFRGQGIGTGRFLLRDIGENTHLVRLDTTWTLPQPERLSSIRLGDVWSRSGLWGRSVLMGGGQWATDFSTQPYLPPFPLPTIAGEAVLPSTVDLYVNDALHLRQDVASGPFSINRAPVLSGGGEMRVVVKDLLGRETVLTQPYYVSPQLLRAGLDDYSYEIGAIRNNFGLRSNDYKRWVAIGTYRKGWTDNFTSEMRGEFLENQQTIGLGAAFSWPGFGVASLAFAGSQSHEKRGGLVTFGYERQAREISLGGRVQLATKHFTQLGLLSDQPAPQRITQLYLSVGSGPQGSLGVSYYREDDRDGADVELVSANYNVLSPIGFLNLFLSHPLRGESATTVGLTLTWSLGEQTSASFQTTASRDYADASLQIQKNLPLGSGMGYRLLGGYQGGNRLEAGFSVQNDKGTYSIEAARYHDETSVRANASGSVAFMGGRSFFGRRLNESFAVVRVPDLPHVRVYRDNQLVAETDSNGDALVPGLRPYQKNPLRIEQADLPLNVSFDTVDRDPIPNFRSGVLVDYRLVQSRGALVTLVLRNGKPVPSGATVKILGQTQSFPVGLNGQAYLTGLQERNRLQVRWGDLGCDLTLSYLITDDPVADLGTLQCNEVSW